MLEHLCILKEISHKSQYKMHPLSNLSRNVLYIRKLCPFKKQQNILVWRSLVISCIWPPLLVFLQNQFSNTQINQSLYCYTVFLSKHTTLETFYVYTVHSNKRERDTGTEKYRTLHSATQTLSRVKELKVTPKIYHSKQDLKMECSKIAKMYRLDLAFSHIPEQGVVFKLHYPKLPQEVLYLIDTTLRYNWLPISLLL